METKSTTFNILVLTDLKPGQDASPKIHPVDKSELDNLLRTLGPTVGLDADTIKIESYKDFRPERLVDRLTPITKLLALRKQLSDLGRGSASTDDVRGSLKDLEGHATVVRELESAFAGEKDTSAPKPAAEAPSGSVFDMVDMEGSEDPAVKSEAVKKGVENIIGAVLGRGSSSDKPTSSQIQKAMSAVDRGMEATIRSVLHHSAFTSLESSWRALRWLVRSLDFRAGIQLHVLPTPRKDLVRSMKELAAPFVQEKRAEGHVVVCALDFSFGLDQLDEAAAVGDAAASVSLPVFAGIRDDVLGLESLDGEHKFDDVPGIFTGDTHKAWHEFRDSEAARFLTFVANRFLLRIPYGKDSDPVRGFSFEEFGEGDPPILPWATPTWFVAAAAAGSFVRTGWGTAFTGQEAAADLEYLPVRSIELRHGESMKVGVEGWFTTKNLRELSEEGIMALSGKKNSDTVFLPHNASLLKKDEGCSARHQIFMAHIATWLEPLMAAMSPQASLEAVAQTIAAGLTLLGTTQSGQGIQVTAAPKEGDRPKVAIRVKPVAEPVRGLRDLYVEVPLPLR